MDALDISKHFANVKFDLTGTKYKFIEKIGIGAYGIVCKAKTLNGNEEFAIKKIKNPLKSRIALIRCLREIKILHNFNHCNIISITDIFMQQQQQKVAQSSLYEDIYVVFNLMETDLHRIVSSKQILTDDHIRYFMYQILCGVNYIHSASVIHRDLKPANILVNANCLIKIADFGMARSTFKPPEYSSNNVNNNNAEAYSSTALKNNENPHTKSSPISLGASMQMTQYVMTRWYRAPELLMGYQLQYDFKVDLWSCGCILAELYLMRPFFNGEDMIHQLHEIIDKMGTPPLGFCNKVLPIVNSLIRTHKSSDVKPLAQLIPNAPKKVIDLLSHLLIYEPENRWSAEQCLKHIFFMKYRNLQKETVAKEPLNMDFELELNTLDDLREALYSEIDKYHPKMPDELVSNNLLLPLTPKFSASQSVDSFCPFDTSTSNIDSRVKDNDEAIKESVLNRSNATEMDSKENTQQCSPNSERTLSASSDLFSSYLNNYKVTFADDGDHNSRHRHQSLSNTQFVKDDQCKTVKGRPSSTIEQYKTVSEDTKQKLLDALLKPKSYRKIITAADKRREKKEKRLRLQKRQSGKPNKMKQQSDIKHGGSIKSQSNLTELDKMFLQRCQARQNETKMKAQSTDTVKFISTGLEEPRTGGDQIDKSVIAGDQQAEAAATTPILEMTNDVIDINLDSLLSGELSALSIMSRMLTENDIENKNNSNQISPVATTENSVNPASVEPSISLSDRIETSTVDYSGEYDDNLIDLFNLSFNSIDMDISFLESYTFDDKDNE